MRLSAKGRYALAALTYMARLYNNGEYITVLTISEELGISKIYLEQVFSLLKKRNLFFLLKAQGGYQLSRAPKQITVLDVLSAVEVSLFEQTQDTVEEKAPEIEVAYGCWSLRPWIKGSVNIKWNNLTRSVHEAKNIGKTRL